VSRAQHSVADFQAHVDTIAREAGVCVDYRERTAGRSWRRTRRIRICRVRSAVTYAIALHELGHVLGRNSGRRLDKEVQAWEWAKRHALTWTKPMRTCAARCVASYLRWCVRKRGAWVPPHTHGAWSWGQMAPPAPAQRGAKSPQISC
jgi:hypothetical protein